MKLKSHLSQAKEAIMGAQVGLLRDDVRGYSLLIQSGNIISTIKLSDLMEFLIEQDKVEEGGSKGDSELE